MLEVVDLQNFTVQFYNLNKWNSIKVLCSLFMFSTQSEGKGTSMCHWKAHSHLPTSSLLKLFRYLRLFFHKFSRKYTKHSEKTWMLSDGSLRRWINKARSWNTANVLHPLKLEELTFQTSQERMKALQTMVLPQSTRRLADLWQKDTLMDVYYDGNTSLAYR